VIVMLGALVVVASASASLTEVSEAFAPAGNGGDFGVHMAADGSTVVIGDPFANSSTGAVDVYSRGDSGTLTEIAQLIVPTAQPGDLVGYSVAIQGDTIVAGAPAWNGSSWDPSVYVWLEPAGGWSNAVAPTARLTYVDQENAAISQDEFGDSVAIDNGVIVAGAPDATTLQYRPELGFVAGVQTGAVALFQEPSGGWVNATQNAVLSADEQFTSSTIGAYSGDFGSSVAINDGIVVVGAPSSGAVVSSGRPGGVFLFEQPSTGWETTTTPDAVLTANEATSPSSQLGQVVATDGSVIAATAYGPAPDGSNSSHGEVMYWRLPPEGWTDATQDGTLIEADNPDGDTSFGASLAMSGDQLLVGDSAGGTQQSGAVYLFSGLASGNLSDQNVDETDNPSGDDYGEMGDVAVFSGPYVVAGAFEDGVIPEGESVPVRSCICPGRSASAVNRVLDHRGDLRSD
jgi:hypothetical protein